MCLAMGNLSVEQIGDAKVNLQGLLTKWHQQAPDSGTHSASGWALRQWDLNLPEIIGDVGDPKDRNWKVTPYGFTMVRIPAGAVERTSGKTKKTITVTRDLWLSDVEVTTGLFQRFLDDESYAGLKPKGWEIFDKANTTPQHPVRTVSWDDAVLFCNWLSEKSGRKPCYELERIEDAKSDNSLRFKVEILPDGTGYRLPTTAEWEYTCRAGTTTGFGFGNDPLWLDHYAVFYAKTAEVPANKMCNRWGLFDIHGNLREWCQDSSRPGHPVSHNIRSTMGGDFTDFEWGIRLDGYRGAIRRSRGGTFGFRVAQTAIPVEEPVSRAQSQAK